MATKKKTKKKLPRAKRTAGGKLRPAKTKKAGTPKKSAKRTTTPKKAVVKRKSSGKKAVSGTKVGVSNKETVKTRQGQSAMAFSRDKTVPRSGEQSGDLQGLSDVEGADSESVDELLEEGNAFEAGVVSGVEEAGRHSGREVHTREVPEDDVPGEYLDNE